MKKLQGATAKDDACTFELQDNVYGIYEHINTKYSPVYPRVIYLPEEAMNNVKTSYLICNKEEMKKVSTQDVFPYGATFTFKGSNYALPIGSYVTYNDKSKHTVKCKNEVLNFGGVDFDDIIYDSASGEVRVGDDVIFEKDKYWKNTQGFYNMSGWLQQETRDNGKISKIEYSRIKNHIWQPQTITKKDVNGQFLLVARGIVKFRFTLIDLETKETKDVEKEFKRGSLLYLTQNVELISGTTDFQVYEFYSDKDLVPLYNNPDFWWVS